ncbi:PAS domain-containing sensor histidine kinase [Sphingomonas sp. CCH5-D11]|uniref:PAS domain-containing sensor histidine kinase n=1 Tax=Sphingomonas sp. CCH5-D11 TaxID=1768786 RepID=UPI00082BE4BD|nr:PAS domain S-box protein [Sphingomonas sp. CCH5-D11]
MTVAGTFIQDGSASATYRSYLTAMVCIGVTVALASVPLLGWMLNHPSLTRFIVDARPTWPLTSVGYIALSFGLLATIRGSHRLAFALASVPAALGLFALAEHLLDVQSGFDLLLLRDQLLRSGIPNAGRPGHHAAITFLLLSASIALANVRGKKSGRVMSVIASLTLAYGALSASLNVQGIRAIDPGSTPLIGSLPAALSTAAMSIGLLAWKAESGWADLMNSEGAEWRILRHAFPVILTAPILFSTLEYWVARSGAMPGLPATFLVAGLNMLVVGGLLFWSSTMLVRGRAAFLEMSYALDTVAVILTDLEGRILHWSRGCQDLYGWTAEEAIGRSKHSLLRSVSLDPAVAAPLANAELVEFTRDGRTLRVLQQVCRLDRHGKDPVLVMSMVDITERTLFEDALRESEARLAMALETHGIAIFDYDVKSGAIDWSAGAEHRLGLQPGDLRDYRRWQRLIHPDDILRINEQLEEVARTRAPRFAFRFRLTQGSGRLMTVEGSALASYDEDGELIRITGVNVDVTDRNEREARLQAREAQLLSILETVPDAMVVINESGQILSFSRTAEQLFSYTAQEVIGRNVSLLTPEEHTGQHDGYMGRYLATGEKRVIGRTRLLTARAADGREIPVELRVGEANTAGERLFTGFIRDISQRLEHEERLNTLRSELTHLSRLGAMGEMAAGLAHELNQPLAASVNFVATASLLLKEGAEPQSVEEMLELARSQALRAGEIIRRLRDFVARHDAEVRAEPVEETLQDAMALVLVGQKQLDVNVRYDLDPAAALMFADRVQVQQVLVNLLRNALEAMRSANTENMTILVQSRVVDPETLEIAVCDNGPGLSPAFLDQMYTPFSSTKGEAGMGIGLSICRRIVESHGGELVGENLPQGGARFRFTLPMIDERELELS